MSEDQELFNAMVNRKNFLESCLREKSIKETHTVYVRLSREYVEILNDLETFSNRSPVLL